MKRTSTELIIKVEELKSALMAAEAMYKNISEIRLKDKTLTRRESQLIDNYLIVSKTCMGAQSELLKYKEKELEDLILGR